ncbi:RluA family pseudouridine synthase [Candidatus Daviesbacteria bacterium]|nr:RluA family pseudouridine synthase [Candidatus Daviesbacteria bacterium]
MTTPRIIYQDNYLLVLDKPPGLVVDQAETVKGKTLMDWLQAYYEEKEYHSEDVPERMGLVHRLDKDTSGILLVGKTQPALENLQHQFKDRVVKKEYLALVHGLVAEPGRVDAAIMRNPVNREKFTVVSPGRRARPLEQSTPPRWPNGLLGGGREAVTEYEPLERLQVTAGPRRGGLQDIFSNFNKIQMRKLYTAHYNLFTLLRCKPKTGRTHQIRVHLKYINHPIVSDEKYGGRKVSRLDSRWCPRIFLHAAKIGFKHPVSKEWMEFESPLPEDLKEALEKLDE